MPKVKFRYEGKTLEFQCTENDIMKDLFELFAKKANLDINSIYFTYEDNVIEEKQKLSALVNLDEEESIQILIFKKEDPYKIDTNKYKLVKKINENLFVVFSNKYKKTYFLKTIDVKKIEKIYFLKKIENLDGFSIDEDNKKYLNILFEIKNGTKIQNLKKITYDINNNDIWKIFILLVIEIKSLLSNNITSLLKIEDIFINENNTPIINYIDLVLRDKNNDVDEIDEISDNIINNKIVNINLENNEEGTKSNRNSYIYSLGKITLFLLTHNDNISLVQKLQDEKFGNILRRILCEEENRLSLNDLITDNIFIEKLVELDLFQELLKAKFFLAYDKKFLPSFLDEDSYFFMCDSCYSIPNILLVQKRYIILKCSKCKISETISIHNLTNYYKNYKIWLGNKCFFEDDFNKNMIEEKYCSFCKKNLCKKCIKCHSCMHNFISLKDANGNNRRPNNDIFEKVLSLYNLRTKEKIKKVNNNLKLMKEKIELKPNDKTLKNIYNQSVSKILEIFFNNLNIGKDLIILNSIIINTIDNIKNNKNEVYNQYHQTMEKIKEFFDSGVKIVKEDKKVGAKMNNYIGYKEEKILSFDDELFDSAINKERNKTIIYADKFPKESEININDYISKSFNKQKALISDFQKKYTYMEDTLDFTENLNNYMTIEKIKNPDNFLDINETIKNFTDYSSVLTSSKHKNFILALLAKYFEVNGINSYVMKKKEEKFKDIELASIQSIFSCGVLRKYELNFNLGEEKNEEILKNKTEQNKFLEYYKNIISNQLKIDSNKIILKDVKRGSLKVTLLLPEQDRVVEESILHLQLDNLTKIRQTVMVNALALSDAILDPKGDRCSGWGINEKRGGEAYIPPLDGWMGIGLKVLDKYENNDWLSFRNISGEYSVAYFGLHNYLKESLSDILSDDIGIIRDRDYISNRLFQKEKDRRSGWIFRDFCGSGVCMFQDPKYAENFAGKIILDNSIIYKILLMCRVNPIKIRQPENHQKFWIMNPTADEIRPYRILFKKIEIRNSPLADNILKTFETPRRYIRKAILSGTQNQIIDSLKTEKRFRDEDPKCDISHMNGNLLSNNDFVIRLYSSAYYIFINTYMLGEKKILMSSNGHSGFTEDQLNSLISCIQKAIKDNRYPRNNITVYRGYGGIRIPDDIDVGSHFYISTFISTSLNKSEAKKFINCRDSSGTGNGILMTIQIQNNDENNGYCSDISGLSLSPEQKEILLCSHCYFLVTGLRRKDNIDYIDLICTGQSFNPNELI